MLEEYSEIIISDKKEITNSFSNLILEKSEILLISNPKYFENLIKKLYGNFHNCLQFYQALLMNS